jgi:cyclophilin family peptidyl-prolyl cis-trans isomerase
VIDFAPYTYTIREEKPIMHTRKLILFITLIALSSVLISCGSTPKTTSKTYSTAPAMTIDKSKQYTATIKTNFGDIMVELFPKEAPLAVNNFVFLAREGFYNGVVFHRVVKGFVIQSGDPTGTGAGGPGYEFADETVTRDYLPGTLAMANSGRNTNGSQFFICLATLTSLPKSYTNFGIVTSGFDVVKQIGNVSVKMSESGEVSSPTVDVHIDTIMIEEK